MLNKAILIGNLGADPEINNLPSGSTVANISVATTMRWKDKQSGERKESTEWHRVVAFNRLAEIIGEYLKKGSQVYIEGRLQTRTWEKDGAKHYTTEIVATEMKMLGVKSDTGQAKAENQAAAYQNNQSEGGQQAQNSSPINHDDFDDDIPF